VTDQKSLKLEQVFEPKKDATEYLCFVDGVGGGYMVLYYLDGYWREKANGLGLKKEPLRFYEIIDDTHTP
jgi:hypothetical protein